MNAAALYQDYQTKMQKIADVKYASAVLQWDQETYLPAKGADARGRQLATLSEIAHERFTDEKLGDLLLQLSENDSLTPGQKKNVQLSLEDYRRNKKFNSDFVRRMSEAVNKSFHAWIQARKANDFGVFQEPLHDLIVLKRQEASILGHEGHLYNALMNDYDKGLTVAIADKVFEGLKPGLIALLDHIRNQPQVSNNFLHRHFNKDKQWAFGTEILKRMQFDWEAGRQDISEHPFTTNFSSKDVRVTTRIDEHDFGNMTWSCIHEGGHALYEQGLPEDQYGLPLGEYCSLSIHESQSRLWENNVGRGMAFWQHNYPLLQQTFPDTIGDISLDDFYKGINQVKPSLIRTEADELTYHFHVMIRYEIEKALIEGSIECADIPAYWNEHYQRYLGVTVPDDRQGCLQDVHWSHGSFGYFATYSLGSQYAAQFYASAQKAIPTLEAGIAMGDNTALLQWLRHNIHRHGRMFTSEELCTNITGEPLNSDHFMNYVQAKYKGIYG